LETVVNRRGFTFVELLMVFTIIGLLTAIAVPRLQVYRQRAMVASMKSDLRTLGLHQESNYYDRASYTDDLALLQVSGYNPSPNVSVVVNEATFLGWSATASHTQLFTECYIFVGDAAPVGTAVNEGSVDCS
jgi:prepilin-type N-terminal cleavage/methylation domain-containing protein